MSSNNNIVTDHSIIAITKVERVEDNMGGGRIKVRISPYDIVYKTDDDLPYCFPLLPKLVHVYPKVGECVLVIWQNPDSKNGQRFYIGPLIAQDYGLDLSLFSRAKSLLDGRPEFSAMKNPERDPENIGTLIDKDDVALRGRSNADVILKPSELRLRCGFLKNKGDGNNEEKLHFNNKDLAYIQMKYKDKMKDANGHEFSSLINIVADRINLLSHDSRTPFSLGDRKDLVTDEELGKIMENAHPVPYGDNLVDFLKKLIEVFKNHTHPYVNMPPTFSEADKAVLDTNLGDYLSYAVRIN